MKGKSIWIGFICAVVASQLAGCTFIFQKGRRSDVEKIEALSQQLDDLQAAKQLLEDRLRNEINDKQVSLRMADKGLVITFVADVLFDSGKADLRSETLGSLSKVARVLKENVPDLKVGIEGHTDSEPIRHSGWKSNWELSVARSLSVLHYLVDSEDISPERVSAIGYGEFQPVSSNDSKEGRRLNRRVEIVILPKVQKVDQSRPAPQMQEPQENLK